MSCNPFPHLISAISLIQDSIQITFERWPERVNGCFLQPMSQVLNREETNKHMVLPIYIASYVTIWKLGRTVCVYSMVQRREKEKDSRYIQEASAPAAEPCIRPVTCLRHKYTCNKLDLK